MLHIQSCKMFSSEDWGGRREGGWDGGRKREGVKKGGREG